MSLTDTYTTAITENGTTFVQHVGGIATPTSAINLQLRYAAFTDGDPDPDPVLWIKADNYGNGNYLQYGYTADGTIVAYIRFDDNWRHTAVINNSHKITPPHGAVTFDAAAELVNAYFRAAR